MWLRSQITRGNIFLVVGVAGFLHELLIHDGAERPFIIAASLAFAGLKWTLPRDEGEKK